jgi:hypothetical protein
VKIAGVAIGAIERQAGIGATNPLHGACDTKRIATVLAPALMTARTVLLPDVGLQDERIKISLRPLHVAIICSRNS